LTAELENAKAALETALKTANQKGTANASTIADLQTKLDALQKEKDSNVSNYESELQSLKESLAAANRTIASQQTELTKHLATIEDLKKQLSELDSKHCDLDSTVNRSKQRLQNLLGMLLVDESIKQESEDYVFGSGTLTDEQTKQFAQALSSDTCDYFKYLNDLVSIQMQYLEPLFSRPGIPMIRSDIFRLLLGNEYVQPNTKSLLKELTVLFQQLFNKLGPQSFPGESYPSLSSVLELLQQSPSKGQVTKEIYKNQLSNYGFLSSYMVVLGPNGSVDLVKKHIKDIEQTNEGFPLVLLSIKMIQLINSILHDKTQLVSTCGIVVADVGKKLVETVA